MRTILFALMILTGLMLSSCTTPTEQKTDVLRRDATQGDADAQNNLGLMYANGEGVKQDYTEAMKWVPIADMEKCRLNDEQTNGLQP